METAECLLKEVEGSVLAGRGTTHIPTLKWPAWALDIDSETLSQETKIQK